MQDSRVDFPQPDGPASRMKSPVSTSRFSDVHIGTAAKFSVGSRTGAECLSDQPLTAPAAMLHANSLPETDQVISATSPVRMRGPEQPIRKPGEVVPEQRCRNRHAENRVDKDQAPQRAMTPGVAQQDHTTGCLAKAHRPAQRAGVLSHMTGDSPARVIKRSVAARVAAAGRPDGPFDGSATAMTSVPGPQAAGCASVRGLTLPPGQRSAF